MTPVLHGFAPAQSERLARILRRHTRFGDCKLTDHELVLAVMERYTKDRGVPLIDPNE